MQKKLILILFIVIFVSLASANSLDSVEFDELPTAWEVGEDLEFSVEASGTSIDRMIFQSRDPGDIIFDTRSETFCQNQDTCTWDFDHTENSEGTWEYRFRAYAGDDRRNSVYREVTYYDNLDYSVSWTDSPPSSVEERQEVEMGVRARDDADRFDSEGTLSLQYRDSDGDWVSFDSRDCSSSSTSSTCSNTGSIELSSEVINDGEADFRGFVEFKGDVTAESSIETVEIDSPGVVDDVNLDDLPSSHPIDQVLEITGDAEGEELDEITLQKREEDGDWERVADESCSGSSCDFEHDYTHEDVETVDFRLKADAGDDTEYSNRKEVDFYYIDEVNIEDLPSEHPVDNDIDIEASAQGTDIDELEVQVSERDQDDWSRVEDYDCEGDDSCSFETDYTADEEEEKDFRVKATTESGVSDYSGIEEVDFVEDDVEASVDDVSIDGLPSEFGTGGDLDIDGEASGTELDVIEIKYREDGSWETLSSDDCDNSDSCSISDLYSTENEGEVDFKIYAEAGDNSDESGIETVEFNDDSEVDSVSIDSLPSEFETGDNLDIDGEASGNSLDYLKIQYRDDGDWERVRRKDCSGSSSCSISGSYTASEDGETDFRIKAEAGDDSDTSSIETVDFVTTPNIDSVSIDSLSSRHPINDNIEISGDASGTLLTSIIIEKRTGGGWSEEFSESCGESNSCSISKEFSTASEGEIDFRIKVDTGEDSRTSSKETVEFYKERSVNSVSIDDLPSRYNVGSSLSIDGDASGTNLDSLEVLTRARDGIGWNLIESKNCGESDSCSISTDYTSSNSGGREFVVKALAGADTVFSSTEYVEFEETASPEVDSVSIDDMPSNHPLEDLDVSVEASGTELDSLSIQYRDESGWEVLTDNSCSGASCSLSSVYTPSEEEDIDFRAKAEAGGDTAYSSTETVSFEEATGPEVSSVNIDDIDGEYPVNTELEFSGEATGNQLDNLTVQERRDGSWTDLTVKDCSGSSCSVTVTVDEENEISIDYRVKAQAGEDEEYSSIETVEYVEEEEETDPSVDSVSLEELPSDFEVDNNLEMTADASGTDLDNLDILYRDVDDISWDLIEDTSCSGSSCTLTAEYTSESPETLEFVAEASAEDNLARSSVEVVAFSEEDDREDDDEGDDGGDDEDDAEEADLDVSVEDRYGSELENVRVEASNGETKIEYTDDDGEVDFDLEPSDYDVEASKTGYRTETQSVDLDAGENEDLRFRLEDSGFGVRVLRLNAPVEVCEGNSFEVEGVFSNIRDRDTTVAVGLEGDVESSYRTLSIDAGEVEEFTLTAERISGTGEKELSLFAENDGRHSKDFTVDSRDCDSRDQKRTDVPTGISLNSRSSIIQGETIRVSGDIQNVRSSRDVEISIDGQEKTETTSNSNGRYQAFVQINDAGRKTVTANAEGVEARKTVKVLPRATVRPLQIPETVLQGEEFDICAEIEASEDAKILLEKEGKVLDSKTGTGNICFGVEASDLGDHRYSIRAINSGVGGEASDTVRVIEQRPEVESFPQVVSTVETESGLAKVTVYNSHSSVKDYNLELSGIESREASQTSKNVVLAPGDQEIVYFYFSPSESAEASVKIRSNGEIVDEKIFDIRAVSSDESRENIGFFDLFF